MFEKLWELLAHSIGALIPWVVIDPYEKGVLLRFGHFAGVLDEGFHWIYPFYIDRVMHDNVVPRTERLGGLSTTTSDGHAIGFEAVITYRIHDVRKALLEVEDLKDAIADSCAGQIGTTLATNSWEQIWHGEALDALSAECRKRGFRWGVEIMGVQLAGVSKVRNLRISMGGQRAPQFPIQLPI